MSVAKLTLSRLENLLMTACDALRGNMDVSQGEVHFRHPPRNSDVYEFIGKGGWSFQPKKGTRTLASGVRANTWQSVIGESPTQFYSPEVPVTK